MAVYFSSIQNRHGVLSLWMLILAATFNQCNCGGIVPCPDNIIDNGNASCTFGAELHSVCDFQCNVGFKLMGNNRTTCTVNMSSFITVWSPDLPTCHELPKISVHDVTNDSLVLVIERFNDLLNYTAEVTNLNDGQNLTFPMKTSQHLIQNLKEDTNYSITVLVENTGLLSEVAYETTGVATDHCSNSMVNNCHPMAYCINHYTNVSCTCNSGYTGNGVDCLDINECKNNMNDCHLNAKCTNTNGSFICNCNEGFLGDGVYCTLDYCYNIPKNECRATCISSNGTYVCECKSGYKRNGIVCADVDECFNSTSNSKTLVCHSNATCFNYDGSFECGCNTGYIGDGTNDCTFDFCANYTLNKCHDDALCVISNGTYTCECKPGFEGDGKVCEDVDECFNSSLNNCDEGAICNNSIGKFTCTCKSGYALTSNATACVASAIAPGGTSQWWIAIVVVFGVVLVLIIVAVVVYQKRSHRGSQNNGNKNGESAMSAM